MQHFLASGWQVIAATSDDEYSRRLTQLGVLLEPVTFKRTWWSPVEDFQAFFRLLQIFRRYRPTLIHQFHVKPIILGNLTARFVKNAKVVNTFTGLGYAFMRSRIARFILMTGYRLIARSCSATIFQNSDDRQFFLTKGLVSPEKAKLVVGSGVDTERFHPDPQALTEPPRILMVSRLLWQKGVKEFVEAAHLVKRKRPEVRFQLGGEWDSGHPQAVAPDWVKRHVEAGTIEFLGYLDRIEEILRTAYLFVLPSYYPEGLPRVLLEAAASAVPVVTTETPGCREAVIDAETGRVIPPRQSEILAQVILELLGDKRLRDRMGRAARERVKREFDIDLITEQQLAVYQEIGIEIETSLRKVMPVSGNSL